jgi:hypothetical protein
MQEEIHIIKLFDYQKPYSDYILAKVLALALLLFVLPARAQAINLFPVAACSALGRPI